MFKKDWKKEFIATKEKVESQIQKINSEIEVHQEEILKIEEERTAALADLQFDSIQESDEKVESLKKIIAQKQRIVEELNPKKSVALHRAATKALDEVIKQREQKKKDSEALQAEIDIKVSELLALITQGREFEAITDEIGNEVSPLLAMLPDELKKEYKKPFFSQLNGQPIPLFSFMKFYNLFSDLKHYEEFKN